MEPKEGQIYRHFKGKNYEVIAVAQYSEDHSQRLVVYRSVEDKGHVSARPIEMWVEEISRPELGYHGPRFKLVN